MQFEYHCPQADGTTLDFNEPSCLDEFDRLISHGVPPLPLVLIIFSRSIDYPDGTRHKVFSRWTKERFRSLQKQYEPTYVLDTCRQLLIEYWAGYEFSNPIGLLIHRITRNATTTSPM